MSYRATLGMIVASAAATAVVALGCGVAASTDGPNIAPAAVPGVAVPVGPGAADCRPGAPGSGTRGGDGGDCAGGSADDGVGNRGGSAVGGDGGDVG
ncbi:hypothetical protein R4282_03890 [Rhodococcus oxybenzonivorans]|uniref:hypothetical protein n=1 Tax=Rhodococcus oxybenzonivorans TaxID=1990687 RepID=UPI002952E8BC|nr:hypothetical protein [Rhodococcus oxybenzonivorans]MDV7352160.1 hypothetical protein [Rhodococcus oxybenzonivorans]